MSKIDITDYTIYRWRYWIGYGLISVILISILTFAGFFLPGGLTEKELQSVVVSNSLDLGNLNTFAIANLPYHILQRVSIGLLGVNIISIKLPSIILAFVSIICAIIMLRIWFKPNVSILAVLIAISTGQFLFMTQDGTPDGMCLMWSILMLLTATIISRTHRFRKSLIAVFAVLTALSLYTPLSIYILIAIGSAVIIHPHLRYLIKQIPKIEIILGTTLALILTTPLLVSIVKDPGLGLILFGIPTKLPNFNQNIILLGAQYFGFNKPSSSTILTPFFELSSMLIIGLGVYAVAKHHATARSHIIAIWSLVLIPVVIINPGLAAITLFPMVLLLAKGLNKLLFYWYGLFPRNPYARIGGLVPIITLVLVLVLSGADRYIYSYRYDPTVVSNFSRDLKLIPKNTQNLLVSKDEFAFYKVVEAHNKTFKVTTVPISNTFLATRSASKQTGYHIEKIITTFNSKDSDRFYMYTKTAQ